MTGDDFVGKSGTVYKQVAGKPPVINLSYHKPTNRKGRPFMPVEFAVAVYRFGHSLIRLFCVLSETGVVDLRPGQRPQPQRRSPDSCRPGHPVENILPVDPGFPPRKQRGASQLGRRPFRAKSSVSYSWRGAA